jgi:hypothetical protein
MRSFLGFLIVSLLFVGCATGPDGAGGRLDRVAPQNEYYARSKAEVFDALVMVLESKGYTIRKQAAAQGILEGEGRLLEGDGFGESRQFLFSAKLRNAGENVTGVGLLLREVEEGDFKAGAVSAYLRKHGRYDGIFEALEAVLGAGSWMPPVASNR